MSLIHIKDIIHEILKTLITNGKGIEVNTSGLKENLLFPKLEILQMYKDLKGEIITVGSDSTIIIELVRILKILIIF
ncbi:hypothetical protein [Clostridium butyricum]